MELEGETFRNAVRAGPSLLGKILFLRPLVPPWTSPAQWVHWEVGGRVLEPWNPWDHSSTPLPPSPFPPPS